MDTQIDSARYEYKFVPIKLRKFLGLWKRPTEDYRKVVREHANNGWRLVQILPHPLAPFGEVGIYELIFERPIK